MNLLRFFRDRFTKPLQDLGVDPAPFIDMIKAARDPRHGDYQANCAMPLAKLLGKKPRDVAELLASKLELSQACEDPEIAGPGFINLRFRPPWLAERLREMELDERLGAPPVSSPKRFVIDYSSPNVAKPMHVGHLRSTIIGDALARLLRFVGHTVITDNHLGDWGLQFGILIHGYRHFRDEAALQADPIREMARLYILVSKMIKESGGGDDEEEATNELADACRLETVKLHKGDPDNVKLWQTMMPWCRAELDQVYTRLGVHFDHTLGESFYNPQLPGVVDDLRNKGIAQVGREGALAISLEEGQAPSLIQKRDGAFTYMTTDLATIRHRVEDLKADVILYVVDSRQALHFKNLFAAARRWGYDQVVLEHVSFGSVLGSDHRPIKTRAGGSIELTELLDEAVERARKIVDENSPELPLEARQKVAEAVGLGAVKYADLSQNRTSDYVFSWDKMLAMDGNTATYMQYAFARVQSIFRKGKEDPAGLRKDPPLPSLATPEERALALALLRFPEALDAGVAEYKPNAITSYLWELATAYSGFFQNCPVLKAETPELRRGRLLLCDLTARTIQQGLRLLGIETIDQM